MSKTIRSFKGLEPSIADNVFIADGVRIIGDVQIKQGASIWYNCVLRGDAGTLKVGENTNIQDATVLHGTSGRQGAEIGDRVSVGHSAIVHACTIHDDVLVGMGAKVLDGAVVESNVVIAAGSVVTPRSHLKSGYMYAGSPAKPKRELSDMDRALIELTWRTYAEHSAEYLAEEE